MWVGSGAEIYLVGALGVFRPPSFKAIGVVFAAAFRRVGGNRCWLLLRVCGGGREGPEV